MTMTAPLRLSAVGDISFEGSESDSPSVECFADVTRHFRQSDLVVGNLECALIEKGDPIAGKCTLRGSPGWAAVMGSAGIDLVSLANNHLMDYGSSGLFSTIDALARAGIRYVGAGRNRREACSPIFVDVAGRRLAFLGRTAVIVSSPSYASNDSPGVAFLDREETAATIKSCRSEADLVIHLIHWGVEEYSYPSPTQRQLARQLVDAGVDVILGHHPHVLQGFEYCGQTLIAYSLGNFVFNEFEWAYVLPDGGLSRQDSPLSMENRRGLIARLHWAEVERPTLSAVYTRLDPQGRPNVDTEPAREADMKVLSAGIRRRVYGLWWQWYALRREWDLRLGQQMSLRKIITNLHRLRPRHLISVFDSLRRSARIVSEKTTNPYE